MSGQDEEEAILDSIDRFLERDVRPFVRSLDHADEYPHDMVAAMKELGLFGATISPEYGGLGLSATIYAKIVERVSAVWMSLSGIFNSHLIMATAVERYGTPEQKSSYLPRFASGELRGGLALTEPDCGTDLQAIRTTARRQGEEYIINGSKMWITNGLHGSCFALLVKTDPKAEPTRSGMSLLIAEKGPGFNVDSKISKLGYKGIDTVIMSFDNYSVSADLLVGGREGHGLAHTLGALELGRINVAARGVGVARAALNDSLIYAQTRKTFGKPISQHQSIQIKLADMATRVEAARLLVEQAALAFDRKERCDLESGMAKLFASEAAMENAAQAMRIHGAMGYSTDLDIERYYRDAPLMCVGEGTNELQKLIIARQLIERNPV